jgi:capsular polysaccharide biosynthesis protein
LYEIDLKKLILALLRRWWLIAAAALVGGTAALLITHYLITPLYSATIKLYVNNSAESGKLISSSDISASKSLVDTYITIIRSDAVLDQVIEKTRLADVTPKKLSANLSSGALNATEVFYITITDADPAIAADIANTIAEIAPEHLLEIVDGSSVKVVDFAKVPEEPSSPNLLQNVAIGLFLGFAAAAAAITLFVVFDARLSSSLDLRELSELPVLGIITDFTLAERFSYYSYGSYDTKRKDTNGEGGKKRKVKKEKTKAKG